MTAAALKIPGSRAAHDDIGSGFPVTYVVEHAEHES
jgi:hypothetical protein